jgi:hypothetical protein
MKFLLCLAMMLGLAACEVTDDKPKENTPNAPEAAQDVTDYSRCTGPSPSSIEGISWENTSRTSQGLEFKMSWTFNRSRLYLSNTCSVQGRTITARVSTPAFYNAVSVDIPNGANNTNSINEPDFKLNCNVAVQPATANYRFQGRCLELTFVGYNKSLVLVPQ